MPIETDRDEKTVTNEQRLSRDGACYAALSLRVKALYHNCMSAACFAREDAARLDDEEDARCLLLQAQCYESVAGWLQNAVKSA